MENFSPAQGLLIDRRVALPSFLQIEPVGQCNLQGRMCPVMFREDAPSNDRPAFMPFENFVSILDRFPRLQWQFLMSCFYRS
jgi:hypothetical protein